MFSMVSFLHSHMAMFIWQTDSFDVEQMVQLGRNGQTNLMSAMFSGTRLHFSPATWSCLASSSKLGLT